MDLLASQGELSPEDQAELSAMSKDELTALVVGMNKNWYQLLERLEAAHRQDLSQLETRLASMHEQDLKHLERRLVAQYDSILSTVSKPETTQLDAKLRELTGLEKQLSSGLAVSSENAKLLKMLKSTLDSLTNESTGR
jgi:Mg2+ and Co2+ transporter CorA